MIDIIIVVVLLALGYGFGSYREKLHYRSIHKREAALADILVFPTRLAPAADITSDGRIDSGEGSGGHLVQGNVVISSDYFKLFVAGLRKLIGGRLTTFETLLDRGRREAILRMKAEAKKLGHNKILNVKFETSSISKGAQGNIGSIEVLAYGSSIRHFET